MAKKIVNKDEQNRKRLLNVVVQIAEKNSELKDIEIATEKRKENILIQIEALRKVSDTLKLSSVKGKGGVLAGIDVYVDLLKRLEEQIDGDEAKYNELYDAIELQAYRLQNKTCERLFPDDNTYIDSRINRLKQARAFVFDKAKERFAEMDLIQKLNNYRKVYIFEEDDESLVLKSILLELGLKNFGGFISNHDAFRIKGDKVLSFEEASIGDDDMMIYAAQKKILPYDIEYTDSKKPHNTMEIDLFSNDK